jgi:Holliday junction resolvase RusA-like endonuclease
MDERTVAFTVAGKPATQGSKNPVVPTYKDGTPVRRHRKGCPNRDRSVARDGMPGPDGSWQKIACECPILVNTREDNPKLDAWRDAVGYTARLAMGGREVFDGLIEATFVFVRQRPKAHYGTGKNERQLKDSAPAAPGSIPDGLKLARAVEDALKGVVYTDDSLIVTHHIGKRYCHRWEDEHVEVTITLLETQTVGDLVAFDMLELPRPEEHAEQLELLVA